MPFSSSETEILGEVDTRSRPQVDLSVVVDGKLMPLRCQVDTGSDDALVFSDLAYAEALGITFKRAPRHPRVERQLPSGETVPFVYGWASVDWFGLRQISVLAPDPLAGPDQSNRQGSSWVLLGLPMLAGTELSIKFYGQPGNLTIKKCDHPTID